MKRSEFPEKAYETFANHELLSKGFMIYLPSQRKEESLGYDALLHGLRGRGIKAVALQYKVVSQYKRPPNCFHLPCFKFVLHKSINGYKQHNIMVMRNTKRRLKVLALYCVPNFVDYQSLYDYLRNGTLLQHSRLLMPLSRINDSKYHFIVFDDMKAEQFSREPEDVAMYSLENVFELQEPLHYRDWISKNDCDQYTFKQELDKFLRSTHSFLIYKCMDE